MGGLRAITAKGVTKLKRKSDRQSASVQQRVRASVLLAIGLPLLVVCSIQAWQVFSRETQSANGAMIDRARASAATLQSFMEFHAYHELAEFVDALGRHDLKARDAAKSWSTLVTNRDNAVGVALLNAQGELLVKWPTELPIDFASLHVNTESVPQVVPADRSTAGADFLDIAVSITVVDIERGPELAPLAYVCVANVSPRVWKAVAAQVLPLAILLGIGAMVTVALILRSIRRNVSAPLASIVRQARIKNHSERTEFEQFATHELEQIARSFGELQDELHETQRQSVAIERRAESKASEETKRINRLLNQALKSAEHDSLTGLTNRRFIEERLEPVFQEQISQRVNVVIAMFDVDNFKPLNDTEGHTAGDRILRFFGELLRGTLREDDIGIRYGGDEFAAILMGISEQQAREICDRIVKLFNRQISATDIATKVTLSSGFASRSVTGARSAAELLAQADEALYEAKRKGKGCVAEYVLQQGER